MAAAWRGTLQATCQSERSFGRGPQVPRQQGVHHRGLERAEHP